VTTDSYVSMMQLSDFDGVTADFVHAVDAMTDVMLRAGAPDRPAAGALASGLLLLTIYNRTGSMDSAEAAHYAVTYAEQIYQSETVDPRDEVLRWMTEEGRTLVAVHLASGLSRAGGIAPLIGG